MSVDLSPKPCSLTYLVMTSRTSMSSIVAGVLYGSPFNIFLRMALNIDDNDRIPQYLSTSSLRQLINHYDSSETSHWSNIWSNQLH